MHYFHDNFLLVQIHHYYVFIDRINFNIFSSFFLRYLLAGTLHHRWRGRVACSTRTMFLPIVKGEAFPSLILSWSFSIIIIWQCWRSVFWNLMIDLWATGIPVICLFIFNVNRSKFQIVFCFVFLSPFKFAIFSFLIYCI